MHTHIKRYSISAESRQQHAANRNREWEVKRYTRTAHELCCGSGLSHTQQWDTKNIQVYRSTVQLSLARSFVHTPFTLSLAICVLESRIRSTLCMFWMLLPFARAAPFGKFNERSEEKLQLKWKISICKKNKLLQEIERTNQKQKRSTEYNVIHSDSLDMNVQRGAS